MKQIRATLRNKIYISAALTFVIGTALSVFVYQTAGDAANVDPLGNPLDESKAYRRALEMYGGKGNLLASEFTQWFGSLWHGRTLGITIACITVFICAVACLVAYHLPSDSD